MKYHKNPYKIAIQTGMPSTSPRLRHASSIPAAEEGIHLGMGLKWPKPIVLLPYHKYYITILRLYYGNMNIITISWFLNSGLIVG